MADQALYLKDILHRVTSGSFVELVQGSETKVTLTHSGGSIAKQRLVALDAYKAIRNQLLGGENHTFLSTTTERDALSLNATLDVATSIRNITIGRNEVWNGSNWVNISRRSSVTSITASTTQTQGNGLLSGDVNVISTVANNNDTVTLPTAVAGIGAIVTNKGSKKIKIFPNTADNLGAGVNGSVSLSAGSTIIFYCYDATNWIST